MPHVFDIRRREKLWSEERQRRLPVERLMEWLNPSSDEHWVDIGAGNGYVTIPLLREGCRVMALDIEEMMIFDLISRVPEGLEEKLTTAIGRTPPIPLDDDETDAVVMVNTLHEIADRQGLVKEISRVLREGGRVHIIEHHPDHEEDGPPKDDRLYPEDIVRMFDGFKVVSYQEVGAFHHTCLNH